MRDNKIFKDDLKYSCYFGDIFIVVCPQCTYKAKVIPFQLKDIEKPSF